MKPITKKFVLKGEVVTETISFTTETGEVLEYDTVKKILVPSKKNQQAAVVNSAGKAFILPSEQFRKWKEDLAPVFQSWYLALYNEGLAPIVRCKIKYLFYFPDIKRRDLLNKSVTIEDALKDHGIILDDTFTVVNDYNIKGWVKRDKPRVEIYITILKPEMADYEVDLTSPDYYIKQKKRLAMKRKIQRAKKK